LSQGLTTTEGESHPTRNRTGGTLNIIHSTTQNSPFLLQRWPQPSPLFVAPTHGGTARPSGLHKQQDVRPAKGHNSQTSALTGLYIVAWCDQRR